MSELELSDITVDKGKDDLKESRRGELGPDGCLVSFSGGGIRSASFNSGVLRSLLEDDDVDISHISTVSGGGYLGTGFITHCLAEVAKEEYANKKIITKEAQRRALIGDETTEKSDTMLWRMERNVNYFLRQGFVSGILSIMLAMITDAAIFFSTGVFLSEIMIAWHGETIMRVVTFGEWHLLAHPMAYAGAILVAIFAFILVFSTCLSCVMEGFVRPVFGIKTRVSFHSPTACWIDVFEQSPRLYSIWRGILQLVGLVAFTFGFYWLMVTFTCIWGVFHLKSNNGESWTWLLSSAGSLVGVLAANLEKNGVIGTINKAAVLLLLACCGPLLIVVMFTRLAMWNVASQLCWYDPGQCPDVLPSYCIYTPGTCRAELFALFNYDDLDFLNIEIAAGAILIFWVLMYNRTSISLHEYYRIKLSTAFYHPVQRDVKLSDLPDRPKLLVNTTMNSFNYPNKEDVNRSSHVFLLSKEKSGSTPTGYVPCDNPNTKDFTANYYSNMMLSTAMAVSGAAVANELGSATDEYPSFVRRLLTFSISFFNFGWGIWTPRTDGGLIIKSLKDNPCIRGLLTTWGTPIMRTLCFTVVVGPGIVLGFLTNYVWLAADSLEVQIMSVVWAGILLIIVPLHIVPGVAAFLSFGPYFRHIQQIFGIPSNAQDYCYLSDGGHLENLGAYELMKEQRAALHRDRRAVGKKEYKKNKKLWERHPIYSFDAGKDDNTLEALYGVLRLALEDNIITSWEFVHDSVKKLVPLKYGEDVGKTQERIIRVTLYYPEGTRGVFYYVKSVLKTEDPDNILLLSYQDAEFPHHSTANQFFNRKLFDSYHTLGRHSGHELLIAVAKHNQESVQASLTESNSGRQEH